MVGKRSLIISKMLLLKDGGKHACKYTVRRGQMKKAGSPRSPQNEKETIDFNTLKCNNIFAFWNMHRKVTENNSV